VSNKQPSLKIKRLRPDAKLPKRATVGSTGLDLFACIENKGKIALSAQPRLIPTGIVIEVPQGYDVQIRPRSGLSAKGIGVTFGTIDSDYRGEILVTMYLFDPNSTFEIKHGDRIAQMVITKIADLTLVEVAELSSTKRGSGGHGSTGE
jgi:dUTP pyrophosphatase